MSYVRKTKDVYHVQCNYGYGYETVTIDDNFIDARQSKKDYIENELKYGICSAVRIVKKREKIGDFKK